MEDMNMAFFLPISFFLLCSTAKCQERLHLSALQPPPLVSEYTPPVVAVHVEPQHLKNVSGSVLAAENWLRNNVLAYYPATNISTIVVGATVFCGGDQQDSFDLILPSLKNLHHSLIRWGLQEKIKVSAAFSSDCLDLELESNRNDVAHNHVKPLLGFLHGVAAPHVINSSPLEFQDYAEVERSHSKYLAKLGFSTARTMYVIARRKLAHKAAKPLIPPRPAPVALPPLIGTLPPLPNLHAPTPMFSSPSFVPHITPPMASPPFGPHLPPCEPWKSPSAPTPAVGHAHHQHGAWCVAKPTVPSETLQEALDYACGEGDADCEAIKENGDCQYPDTLVAHASYAFNSYWQKTKAAGGTCGFGGTAMIITSDPSYGQCRFTLT